MKFFTYRTALVNFPFQPKRFSRFYWILIFVFCVGNSAFANDDVQQIEIRDSKQIIKQAEKLTRRGNLLEAEKLLRALLTRDTHNINAKLGLSYVLLKQKRLEDSLAISYEIAKKDPKNARAFSLVGINALFQGNFKEAELLLFNAYKLDKEDSLSWYGAGLLDFFENRITSSIEKLETAISLEPNDPDFVFTFAQALARDEKYKEAADAYDRFLQIAPKEDLDRRQRIKGLIGFLRYIGGKSKLYDISKYEKTVLPFSLVQDRPIIELSINGKKDKLRFVLDTGSAISVISEETADKLKIKSISKGGMARAVGGDGKFQIVYGFLNSVNFEKTKISNVPVYIRKFHDTGANVDGYIGLSLISKFLTTVDYPKKEFTLIKAEDSLAVAPESALSLPLRLTSSGFLSGEVQIHGINAPLNFIVDTGASISVVSDDLAKASDLHQFSTNETMRVVGAAGITENVPAFMLPKVSFGNHTREEIKAIALDLDVINEASGFIQTGIIGGNFLKNYSLTFDFKKSKVTFSTVNK